MGAEWKRARKCNSKVLKNYKGKTSTDSKTDRYYS